jgi:argininosuccinate lyase
VTGRAIVYDEERLRVLLSPEHFVGVRRTPGGPAPEVTARAIEESQARLSRDRETLTATRARLANAAHRRHAALEAL